MANVRKQKLEEILSHRLKLKDPQFELERVGGKYSGNIIDDSFFGEEDSQRQKRIWDALDEEFGAESTHLVGTLLAYTKAERNVHLADPSAKDRH